jgi:hypothetical protein
MSGATREAYLAHVLREVGPVLTVGKPGEVLPHLGAQRIYFSNEEWQAKVLELIKSARLIVLSADITDGLHWEIVQVINHAQPEKTIVALPYGRAVFGPLEGRRNRNARAEAYNRFRQTDGVFPAPLPPSMPPYCSYLGFDPSWRPRVLLPPASWKTFVLGQNADF